MIDVAGSSVDVGLKVDWLCGCVLNTQGAQIVIDVACTAASSVRGVATAVKYSARDEVAMRWPLNESSRRKAVRAHSSSNSLLLRTLQQCQKIFLNTRYVKEALEFKANT